MVKKILVGLAVLAAAIGIATPAESRPAEHPRGEVPGTAGPPVPGQYIVVLDDGHPSAVAGEHARQHGASIRHVYGTALRGYSARMSSAAAERIARDPRVAWVEQDTIEEPVSSPVPTGVDRIEADKRGVGASTNPVTVNLPIAIIDTGINPHVDLNVAGGVDFTGSGSHHDPNGHGTHVAGTVAGKGGVLGVAPGAPVWSVRVCVDVCYTSHIVAGIDWITAQKKSSSGPDFAAANFSISSADTRFACSATTRQGVNATHTAICGLVDAGVPFVMAAGNDGRRKDPYPEAFSVSAIADFDGKGGGAGSPTCRTDTDDTLANFSNHGPNVNIAAPGVCIRSTWNNGGYHTISGTSMAAPHVTGAVALYLKLQASNQPARNKAGADAIRSALVGGALQRNAACSYADNRDGGPMLFLDSSSLGGNGVCDLAGAVPPPNSPPTASFTHSCAGLTCDFTDASTDSDGSIASRLWSFGDGAVSAAQNPSRTYAEGGTFTVTLTVTDNGGATGTTSKSVTVTAPASAPPPDAVVLSATGYKIKGVQHADLTWSGSSSGSVDVLRDGARVATVSSSSSYTDNLDRKGGGSATYKVCKAGTSTCSNTVTVSF